MCGLVGIVGYDSLSQDSITLFNRMLHADTFRGPHSTGVLGVRPDLKAMILKKALDAPTFIEDKGYRKWMDKGKFRVLMGHNRYATHGEINTINAHPFMEDHFVGMHNGTLWNHDNLEEDLGKKYDVDSAAMIAYLSKHRGTMEKAFGEFNGSYAVTGYDMVEKKLIFARNNQRPLAMEIVRVKGDIVLVYASEKKMLDWLLDRHGWVHRMKDQELISVGEGSVFKYPMINKATLKPETFEIPRKIIKNQYYEKWSSNSLRSTVTQPSHHETIVKRARAVGISRFNLKGEPIVMFRVLKWVPYAGYSPAGTKAFGRIKCQLLRENNLKEDIDLEICSTLEKDYEGMDPTKVYRAKINTIFQAQGSVKCHTITIMKHDISDLQLIEQKPQELPLDVKDAVWEEEDFLTLEINNEEYNEPAWDRLHVTCANCDHPIGFMEAMTAPGYFRNSNTYICGLCSPELQEDME